MQRPDIRVGKATIGNIVDILAESLGDNIGLEYHLEDIRLNFRQLREKCDAVAKGLMALGIHTGDKVAIWANNRPEWVYTQYGSARMGAVLVTVNTNYRSSELEYLLRQSDATTLILTGGIRTPSDYIEVLHKVCPAIADSEPGQLHCEKLPFFKNIIYLGEEKIPGPRADRQDAGHRRSGCHRLHRGRPGPGPQDEGDRLRSVHHPRARRRDGRSAGGA